MKTAKARYQEFVDDIFDLPPFGIEDAEHLHSHVLSLASLENTQKILHARGLPWAATEMGTYVRAFERVGVLADFWFL
jgi:hypothetical protein